MLEQVSVTNELRPGFVQSSYKKGNARSIVLLFDVKKDVVLPNHRHGQHQFGYTFHGEYDFLIDGRCYLAKARDSYHIAGGIYHSAVANTDYYSMDFKYIGKDALEAPLSFNVIRQAADADGTPCGEVRFHEASSDAVRAMLLPGAASYRFAAPATGLERLIVVSRDTRAELNGKALSLERMKIYKLDGDGALQLKLPEDGVEAFLYEI